MVLVSVLVTDVNIHALELASMHVKDANTPVPALARTDAKEYPDNDVRNNSSIFFVDVLCLECLN